MGVISHLWPGITPFNVNDLQAHWWAYYVRAAIAHQDAVKELNRGR